MLGVVVAVALYVRWPAGQESVRALVKRLEGARRVGVCLDTCHLFAAGYDLRSAAGYEAAMAECAREVGISRVVAFHLNDARARLGHQIRDAVKASRADYVLENHGDREALRAQVKALWAQLSAESNKRAERGFLE